MFNQTRIPLTYEVDEVVSVTRMYLSEYFEIRYADITEFITNMTGTAFILQQPFVINYTSIAVFNSMKMLNVDDDDGTDYVVPPMEELDIVLIAAFTTTNLAAYIKKLQGLPPDNIFRTTSNVTFMIDPMTNDNTTTGTNLRIKNDNNDESTSKKDSRQSAKVTAGVTAGAGVFLLALISVLAVRRRKNQNGGVQIDNHDIQPNKRNLNNRHDDEGHMTVSGDTYLAESTVISGGTTSILSSLSVSRRRFRNKRILSQGHALTLAPNSHINETQQYLTLTQQQHQQPSPPPHSDSSPSDVSMRHGLSDIGSNDHYDRDNPASDQDVYQNDGYDNDDDDDRSLLPFYTASPEPAYRGALSVDVNERRLQPHHKNGQEPPVSTSSDVLLSMRDDMRLPRHFPSPNPPTQQYCTNTDDNSLPNQMVLHYDIDDNCGNDDDTLSVDDDVPLRVIDLIRKFTPIRRHKSR